MLREVKDMSDADLIIYKEGVWTPEELAEELDLRFLVEEDEEEKDDQVMESEEDDDDEEPEVRNERRRRRAEIERAIRDAKEQGFTNAYAISKQTGISYKTVHKYMKRQEAEE